jgi:aminoglycoside/choline kinase family phosphotransferase
MNGYGDGVEIMNARQALIERWLDAVLATGYQLSPLAGDASFRRYIRVHHDDQHSMLMDAPPEHEDVRPFLRVATLLANHGVRTPQVIAHNEVDGLLLLEDFGDTTWAAALQKGTALAPLLDNALQQLHRIQSIATTVDLPLFDAERMRRECALWTDWYMPHIAGVSLSEAEREHSLDAMMKLFSPLLDLPQVVVHLDFHSRNLMVPNGGMPLGVIDFQDAVIGPVTYDLASLLYDCYQDYPEALRQQWSHSFFIALPQQLQQAFDDAAHWHRCLRLTAMQRHIKAIGIFTRLAHRDGKRQFLEEIPLTRKHLDEEIVSCNVPALASFIFNQK